MVAEGMAAVVLTFMMSEIPESERECLALNVYHEARDQSYLGQTAVAEVTMNRVKSESFPNSVCDVVYQPYAFSWTLKPDMLLDDNGQPIIKNIIDKKAWDFANVISSIYLNGVETNITQNSLYYHNQNVSPYWSKCFIKTVVIEDHIFYSAPLQLSPCHRE